MRGHRSKRSVRGSGAGPTGGRPARPPVAALPDWMGSSRVFMPQGHEPGYAYPLLVWLPDGATTACDTFDMGRAMARLSLRNYVAVLPCEATADPQPVAGGPAAAGVDPMMCG